jgi:hypothetical protein
VSEGFKVSEVSKLQGGSSTIDGWKTDLTLKL